MRLNVNEVWCIMFKHIYILCRHLHCQSADVSTDVRSFIGLKSNLAQTECSLLFNVLVLDQQTVGPHIGLWYG